MTRHSFIRLSKLPDVKGRVDYISNPKRQEHLYVTYSTVEPEFWQYLSEQAQHDFRKSNQSKGKCIEARELIIALPESMQEKPPELLPQLFTETFREKYGVQCTAALHHNKAMTNYHIHLIFADRMLLEQKEIKYATRNMFYDEQGHHVRTKKEILDADGNIRPGCKVIAKGEVYDMKWFSPRIEQFKTRQFIAEIKTLYTDLINQLVEKEEDRLKVFDASGPYLATKKIGKNNPMEAEIRADNAARQEWNQMVDQVMIAGGTIEEVSEFKQEEVVQRVAASVDENGNEPGLFRAIIRSAISILEEFLQYLMESKADEAELSETPTDVAFSEGNHSSRGPRPDIHMEELEYRRLELIHSQLGKVNRKLYALKNRKKEVLFAMEQLPKGLLHRKERKTLQEQIDGIDRQIEQTSVQLNSIPKQNGYDSVKSLRMAYEAAKDRYEAAKRLQAEWDGIELPTEKKALTQKQKISVLKQLAAARLEASSQSQSGKKKADIER